MAVVFIKALYFLNIVSVTALWNEGIWESRMGTKEGESWEIGAADLSILVILAPSFSNNSLIDGGFTPII